jgi:hypothetical protein
MDGTGDKITMQYKNKSGTDKKKELNLDQIFDLIEERNTSGDILSNFNDARDFDKFTIMQVLVCIIMLIMDCSPLWMQ